jgi:hypothetical protein
MRKQSVPEARHGREQNSRAAGSAGRQHGHSRSCLVRASTAALITVHRLSVSAVEASRSLGPPASSLGAKPPTTMSRLARNDPLSIILRGVVNWQRRRGLNLPLTGVPAEGFCLRVATRWPTIKPHHEADSGSCRFHAWLRSLGCLLYAGQQAAALVGCRG